VPAATSRRPAGEVRAVVFDFGNVISAFDTSKFLVKLAARSPLPVERLREIVYGSGLHARFEAGRISGPAFHREVVSRGRVDIGVDAFVEAFAGIFTPVPGTTGLIRRLASRYPTGLLSNTNPWHFRHHIRLAEAFPCFSTVTLSYRVRALKPDPAIYADAVAKLGLPAGACVYFDDIPEYAEGACRAGMRGIPFTTAAAAEAALRGLGVDTNP
jgi:putative hydrolase of the HAD superfamily